ncbi:unnamed protein product, partial [marine sediment metagenome]
ALSKDTIQKPLIDGLKKIVYTLEGLVKGATVVDTGILRASISSEVKPLWGKVGTIVDYAPFVELGTSKMEARHMVGGIKVLGKGMFEYASELLKKKFPELLKGIGKAIQTRFEK